MDYDWENQEIHYSGEDEPEYGGRGEREEGDEGSDEGSIEFGSEYGEPDDDIDFRPDFKQLQQVSSGKQSEIVAGVSLRLQKSLRTPEEAAREQIMGVLGSPAFANLSEDKKKGIGELLEKVPKVHVYNVETLVLAGLWKIDNHSLDKSEFAKFYKQYLATTNANRIDLLRYIRLLDRTL